MKHTEAFETQIKVDLSKRVEHIEPSQALFLKVRREILEKEGKNKMNKVITNRGIRKWMIAGAVGIFSIAAIAAPMVVIKIESWHSGVSLTSFPSEQTVKKEVNYVPKYLESLPGGFTFSVASITYIQGEDEEGTQNNERKGITFYYDRGDKEKGKYLSLNTTPLTEEMVRDEKEDKIVVGDRELFYVAQTMKFVPVDYKLTKEDEEAVAAGQLGVSYGADEVEVSHVQTIVWYEEGISYMLQEMNYVIDKAQLIEMVQAIMNK